MNENYEGAVEAYEKALEANPRNASAHFELFVLYSEHAKDYAAAIYYGNKFLRLRPKSEYATVVRQRLVACKQELAKELPVVLQTPALEHDFERLSNENKALRQQVALLTQKLALATNRPPLAQTAPMDSTNVVRKVLGSGITTDTESSPQARHLSPPVVRAEVPTAARTHTVRSGETMVRISLKYNVSLAALLAANPGVNARKIKPGQVLKIPGR